MATVPAQWILNYLPEYSLLAIRVPFQLFCGVNDRFYLAVITHEVLFYCGSSAVRERDKNGYRLVSRPSSRIFQPFVKIIKQLVREPILKLLAIEALRVRGREKTRLSPLGWERPQK